MKNENDLKVLRHSAAHLAAHALLELYPDILLTIGPATEEGFFYDFLPKHNLKEEDLALVEARMHEISKRNYPIEHREIPKAEARELYKNNPFKLELIDQIPGETVGLSVQGDFSDLCRGGHVASTGDIKYFKLLGLAGSYWRANKENEQLQRVRGTAFFTKEELDAFIKQREEAALYDHRRVGKQLDLFSFHEEGVGFPFFHPKGKRVMNILRDYMRKIHNDYGFQEISTPTLLNEELWHRSGHYAHYKDNMYFTDIDETVYAVKPMNCPGSILIYKNRPKSYRELPLKLSEFGHVHRHELSGVLHGLMRVRAFTIDDSHIYCTIDQIEQEVCSLIKIILKVFKKFNFTDVKFALATKPEKAMGSDEVWQKATDALRKAMIAAEIPFTVKEGDGAFYGPKIEVLVQDSMNRQWQCSTVQLDFFAPENFDLHYVTPKGTSERPIIIHYAIYGSFERFFAILLEHYKGHLPFWLSPIQAKILTITDDQKEYAKNILAQLKAQNIRAELDESSDPLSGKIKNAQLEKIPWMIVIGKKEVENNTVTLRLSDGTQETGITADQLVSKATQLNDYN